MAKNKKISVLPLAIGLFLVILLMGVSTNGRSASPTFDGIENDFSMSIVAQADRAEVGDIYWVDVRVTNEGDEDGSMWAQCSILDENEHQDFLPNVGQSVVLGTGENDNCVAGEPFTQTARVELTASGPNSSENFRLQFQVPDTVGGDNYLYCAIYERCYSDFLASRHSDPALHMTLP